MQEIVFSKINFANWQFLLILRDWRLRNQFLRF